MVLWSFATLRRPCPALLEAACKRAQARLPALSPHHLAVLLWALARLLESGGSGEGGGGGEGGSGGGGGLIMAPSMAPLELLRQAAAGPAAARLAGMTPHGVVMLAWAYASSGVQPGGFGVQPGGLRV